jgi:hypothetical protein
MRTTAQELHHHKISILGKYTGKVYRCTDRTVRFDDLPIEILAHRTLVSRTPTASNLVSYLTALHSQSENAALVLHFASRLHFGVLEIAVRTVKRHQNHSSKVRNIDQQKLGGSILLAVHAQRLHDGRLVGRQTLSFIHFPVSNKGHKKLGKNRLLGGENEKLTVLA